MTPKIILFYTLNLGPPSKESDNFSQHWWDHDCRFVPQVSKLIQRLWGRVPVEAATGAAVAMVAAGFEAAGEAAVNPDIDGDGVGVPKRDPPAAVLGAAAAVVGAGGVGKRAGLLIADSGFWGAIQ